MLKSIYNFTPLLFNLLLFGFYFFFSNEIKNCHGCFYCSFVFVQTKCTKEQSIVVFHVTVFFFSKKNRNRWSSRIVIDEFSIKSLLQFDFYISFKLNEQCAHPLDFNRVWILHIAQNKSKQQQNKTKRTGCDCVTPRAYIELNFNECITSGWFRGICTRAYMENHAYNCNEHIQSDDSI